MLLVMSKYCLSCFLGKAPPTATPSREHVKFHTMSHFRSLVVRKFHTPQDCSGGWTKDMVSWTGSCSCFLCAYAHLLLTPMQRVCGSKVKMSMSSKSQTFLWNVWCARLRWTIPLHIFRGCPTNFDIGNVPPKSKKIDLHRVATSLRVFNFITDELLQGQKPSTPPSEISLKTLLQAKLYVEYAETQKEIVMEVSRCINFLIFRKL